MDDLEVIERPEAAALALDPLRARILAELARPGSAASLAERVGLTRQKVNYHLRVLEEHGLVEQVGERQWGGIRERLMKATAASYVVSPAAMGPLAADPARSADRMSASYLIAVAARCVQEVGGLWRRARRQNKRLATLSIDTVIRFRSPSERAAFTRDLTNAVATLAARFHADASTPGARPHRLVIASYPSPHDTEPEGRSAHAGED